MRYKPQTQFVSIFRSQGLVGVVEPIASTEVIVPGGGVSNWGAVSRLVDSRHYWRWAVMRFARGEVLLDVAEFLQRLEMSVEQDFEPNAVVILSVHGASADVARMELEGDAFSTSARQAQAERNILLTLKRHRPFESETDQEPSKP